MTDACQIARRLAGRRGGAPVISLYFDLDPGRFATAPARAAQIGSLVDRAHREIAAGGYRSHADKAALRGGLARIDSYLRSREPPFKGARALAVFASGSDAMFEVAQLTRSVHGQVVIADAPFIGPLVEASDTHRWCVALVSRASARVLTGFADMLTERQRLDDAVHGQHEQGGFSQANYQRSIEKDADDHLRRVAGVLTERFRREGFDRLALGGPSEVCCRLASLLPEELRKRVLTQWLAVDLSSATDDDVRWALRAFVDQDERRLERDALHRLAAGIGAEGHAVGGPEGTVLVLNERRVQTLLLEPGFDRPGARCRACGLLLFTAVDVCPADGGPVQRLNHLREAMIETALTQDADVIVVRHHPDLGSLQGVGALLRF